MGHPVAGELFAQRFLVENRIAIGGMGAIFRAVDQRTGRPVALKLLQSQVSAADVERFAREAQILGELRHPHIVPYVAHGGDEADQPYLAMEWLEGENLAERIRHGIEEHKFEARERIIPVTVSIGVAAFPDARVRSAGDLIVVADETMYEAKRSGRNRVCMRVSTEDDEKTNVVDRH